MGFLNFLRDNAFTLLQSLGIIGGLLFTGVSLRIDAKVRRVANLFEVTKQHREIWTAIYSRPDLQRVIDPKADLSAQPITAEEKLFVNFLLLHLAGNFRAAKAGVLLLPEEIHTDIVSFLSLPIPHAVWARMKSLHEKDFVQFIERNRHLE